MDNNLRKKMNTMIFSCSKKLVNVVMAKHSGNKQTKVGRISPICCVIHKFIPLRP